MASKDAQPDPSETEKKVPSNAENQKRALVDDALTHRLKRQRAEEQERREWAEALESIHEASWETRLKRDRKTLRKLVLEGSHQLGFQTPTPTSSESGMGGGSQRLVR